MSQCLPILWNLLELAVVQDKHGLKSMGLKLVHWEVILTIKGLSLNLSSQSKGMRISF